MSSKDLLAAGFKEFPPVGTKCKRMWSKSKEDKVGERFRVHVRLWEHRLQPGGYHIGWDAEAQFQRKIINGGIDIFNVLMLDVKNKNPADVMSWFDLVWCNLSGIHLKKFQEQE